MRNKIVLNIKFKGKEVLCAKSPLNCKECKDKSACEKIDVYYYPYTNREIQDCFKNDERNR